MGFNDAFFLADARYTSVHVYLHLLYISSSFYYHIY